MEIGEIYRGTKTNHPIIFIREDNEEQFIGCIITHSRKYPNNIAFRTGHFIKYNDEGTRYDVQFDNSYFVKLKLIKRYSWGSYNKVGQLTEEGVSHMKSHLEQIGPRLWSRYIRNIQ